MSELAHLSIDDVDLMDSALTSWHVAEYAASERK